MGEKSSEETYQQLNHDPVNWRWYAFYYNKKDKRIFVPERSGIGWSLNFANPAAVAILISWLILTTIFTYVFLIPEPFD